MPGGENLATSVRGSLGAAPSTVRNISTRSLNSPSPSPSGLILTSVTVSVAAISPLYRKAFVHHSAVKSPLPAGTGTPIRLPLSGAKLCGRI